MQFNEPNSFQIWGINFWHIQTFAKVTVWISWPVVTARTEVMWSIKSSSEISQYRAELELQACAPALGDQASWFKI